MSIKMRVDQQIKYAERDLNKLRKKLSTQDLTLTEQNDVQQEIMKRQSLISDLQRKIKKDNHNRMEIVL